MIIHVAVITITDVVYHYRVERMNKRYLSTIIIWDLEECPSLSGFYMECPCVHINCEPTVCSDQSLINCMYMYSTVLCFVLSRTTTAYR